MGFQLGEREDISDCLGPYRKSAGAHVHRLTISDTEYGVLFIPMGSWEDDAAETVCTLTNRVLPDGAYEVKFDLMSNMSGCPETQYQNRQKAGLAPFSYADLMSLGRGILATVLMFRDDYGIKAFYAIAVDGDLKLCNYYKRLLKKHSRLLIEQENLEPVTSDEGLGYALYCTR